MTNTHLWNINDLVIYLQGMKKRNINYVIFNIGSVIRATVPSKKLPYYKVGFSMAKDIFEKEDIGPISHSKHILPFSGFLVQKEDENLLNQELLKQKKELEKEGRKDYGESPEVKGQLRRDGNKKCELNR